MTGVRIFHDVLWKESTTQPANKNTKTRKISRGQQTANETTHIWRRTADLHTYIIGKHPACSFAKSFSQAFTQELWTDREWMAGIPEKSNGSCQSWFDMLIASCRFRRPTGHVANYSVRWRTGSSVSCISKPSKEIKYLVVRAVQASAEIRRCNKNLRLAIIGQGSKPHCTSIYSNMICLVWNSENSRGYGEEQTCFSGYDGNYMWDRGVSRHNGSGIWALRFRGDAYELIGKSEIGY
jgi:hypothetical protein